MEYYLAVVAFTFVGALTPGPNTIMLMVSGLNHGVRKSVPHYLGVCLGFPLLVLIIGLGMGALFIQYPFIHQGVKIIGVLYLCYLAWKIANAGGSDVSGGTGTPLTFMQAAAFQWVNPKAWAVAASAVAAFTIAGRIPQSIAFIAFACLTTGFITMGLWLVMGASLKMWLGNERRVRVFNITMAVVLLLSIVPMVASEFPAQ